MLPRMGSGVGVQYSPVASSRRYSASPAGSRTGSFDQGVNRFCWLFTAQVQPSPASLTRQPKRSLASTLAHGIGVQSSPARVMMYSRPSALNPPRPLSNWRSWAGAGAAGAAGGMERGQAGTAAGSSRRERSICSRRPPASASSTTRATVLSSTWSSAGMWSARRTKMPPGRSSQGWESDELMSARSWPSQPLGIAGGVLIENHQVHDKVVQPPIFVGAQELAGQVELAVLVHFEQQNRDCRPTGRRPTAPIGRACSAPESRPARAGKGRGKRYAKPVADRGGPPRR